MWYHCVHDRATVDFMCHRVAGCLLFHHDNYCVPVQSSTRPIYGLMMFEVIQIRVDL